ALVLGTAVAALANDQPIQWTNRVNVAVRGDRLEKIDGCQACDDAGATSRQMILAGDGYAEFTVDSPNAVWVAGLGHDLGSGIRFSTIDFAFRFNGDGSVDIVENGTSQSLDETTDQAGDIF